MTPTEIVVEVVGWAGAALILLAYLLLSMGRLTGQSVTYQAMNVAAPRASSSTAGGTAQSRRPC